MKTKLYRNLNKDEEQELKNAKTRGGLFLKKVIELVEEENDLLFKAMIDEDISSSSDWALSQARRLAQIKANNRFIDLLK